MSPHSIVDKTIWTSLPEECPSNQHSIGIAEDCVFWLDADGLIFRGTILCFMVFVGGEASPRYPTKVATQTAGLTAAGKEILSGQRDTTRTLHSRANKVTDA